MGGKNKLLQIALGKNIEDEYNDNLLYISKRIVGGNIGLLLTSKSRNDVESFFNNFIKDDYPTAGFISKRKIQISNDDIKHFPVSMVEQLRKLGLQTEIKNGTVVLADHKKIVTICKENEILSVEKCK